jgi:nucleoside-diphosphate-sugar epimerase
MILVTGASGFIGGHVVEHLRSLGRPVRCLVRRTSSLRYLSGADLAFADLASGEGLLEALAGVDCVIHLAGVTKALRARDYYTGNAGATASLVRAMAGHPARLVHVSSLAAAGPSPDGIPLDEDAPPAPFTHYGKSKLEAERIARRLPGAVIVRPPVVYGPRDGDVFRLLQSISKGLVLEISGGDRWFSAIYVKDLAEGLAAAASTPAAAGRTYYLTHPKPLTWAEFGGTAAAVMNRYPRILRVPRGVARAVGFGAEFWSFLTRRPGIISREKVSEALCTHWTCSAARASRELGFTARTGIRYGLTETLAWYKEAGWLAW